MKQFFGKPLLGLIAAAFTLAACATEPVGPINDAAYKAPHALKLSNGDRVILMETIRDEANGFYRLRYLAPSLRGFNPPPFNEVHRDMWQICNMAVAMNGPNSVPGGWEVMISLSSDRLPFGELNRDVLQYFESYRVSRGRCVLDML